MASERPKAIVVGAGPVGCLTAISLAQDGWAVDVYEGRADLRLPSSKAASQQRSINLAISARGITALRAVLGPDATTRVLQTVIPMHGRMIHHADGRLESQAYDRHGQCINSIDRALLNESLLSEAAETPHVRVFFLHKVQSIDFDAGTMVVRDIGSGSDVNARFDFCVGTDGSYSVVRRQMMRVVRMDYEQTYIPHEYIELKMPAGIDPRGQPAFQLNPGHLHIWPRHSFMLIALPNKDKTFTCTLFAPTSSFDMLAASSRETQLAWFREHFPDALTRMGADAVLDDLERNPRGALISIKASPYHYADRALLLGDAAHAMVPFYGQGLNCGLEDVRVLRAVLRDARTRSAQPDDPRASLGAALAEYSASRRDDLHAISELAMKNYTEMRHDVTTPAYLLRKAVDNALAALTAPTPHATGDGADDPVEDADGAPFAEPRGWLPLYTMVTFRPDIAYGVARRKAERQAQVLSLLGWAVGGASAVGIAAVGAAWWMGVIRRH